MPVIACALARAMPLIVHVELFERRLTSEKKSRGYGSSRLGPATCADLEAESEATFRGQLLHQHHAFSEREGKTFQQ